MFRDPSVPHPAGSVDAARDVRAMEDEVILADLGVVERPAWNGSSARSRRPTLPELRKEQEILQRCREALEAGKAPARARARRGRREAAARLPVPLCEAAPDRPESRRGRSRERARTAVKLAGIEDFLTGAATRAVPICAKIELEIAELDDADRAAFMADLGLHESGLDRVIRASYDLLGYISFFTVGEDECRAWSIPRDTPAVLAAGEIHSDISRGFIRAEGRPLRAPAGAPHARSLPRPR
jgi:ribosome-binding ATPase YchF (GTP1/OBG family)